MIDQKTTNQEYPLPDPNNKLSVDVLRIQDTFEKIDVDVGVLHTASTNALTDMTNIRNGSVWQATATGFGGAYEVSLTPPPSSLVTGQIVYMRAHVENTGPATLKIDTLDPKTIKKTDGSDIKAGDIVAGAICNLHYDGINFQLLNPKVDQEQIEIATSNLMLAFEEIQESHGGSLNMETGWSDSFSNANEQGADEANSSGYQHDVTNKLYKGIDPGIGLNSDKDYITESNYIQQEWTNTNQTSSQATIASGTTVTLSSGIWPTNCVNGHISFDSGSTWFDISSRNSDTSLTLNNAAFDGTFNYTIRMSSINNESLRLSQKGNTDFVTINTNGGGQYIIGGNGWNWRIGQSFKATTNGPLRTVKFYIKKHPQYDNGGNGLTAYLASVSGSSALPAVDPTILATSNNVSHTTAMQPNYTQITFTFPSPHNVTAENYYMIWLEQPGYTWSSPYYAYFVRSSGANNSVYSDGISLYRDSTGHGTWVDRTSQQGDYDLEVQIGDVPDHPISEYISICDSESQKTNSSGWLDINSAAANENLNSQSSHYWLGFNPTSGYGDGTEIKIVSPSSITLAGNTGLTPTNDGQYSFVEKTVPVGNNELITHIGLKVGFTSAPTAAIKIYKENSDTDYDVLYTQDIAPVNDTVTTTWYALDTPYLTPATGIIRIGVYFSGGSGRATYNNEITTQGNSFYWGADVNLSVGNHSGSWLPSPARFSIGYKKSNSFTGWRTIAKNESDVWKYNNSVSGTTYTPATASTNDMLHAISEAISSQSANRMTKLALESLTDSEWESAGGWSSSVNSIVRGVTLYSNQSGQSPSVSRYSLNYDSERAAMDLKSKTYDSNFVPSEAYLWARAEHTDVDGVGTFSISRNGGTQWESISMDQQGLSFGDIRVMRGTANLSGQTSGQDLRCRYQTSQGKDQFLHSWGLQAKP